MGVVPKCTWGAKYSLRKAVNRLTGPTKTAKTAHNTGFCDWRGPAAPAGVMPLRDEMRGRAALGLRLSLRHNPLVNSVAVCAESPGQTGKGTFWPPIAPAPGRSSVARHHVVWTVEPYRSARCSRFF